MVPGLLGRLRSRVVLVVGKGGVGKSTTAGALALGLADRGERVHLLSTDPAHSLADLFEVDSSEGPAGPPPGVDPNRGRRTAPRPSARTPMASPCTPRLVLEELDAEEWTRERVERIRDPLQELLDRGTWLDPDDVSRFLDLTLPGMDEVAAALRLADLISTDCDRIVVDTAPTGHTLRLLDAPELVEGWVRAFQAMQEKARAVAEALVRQPVSLAADPVVDEFGAGAAIFRKEVLERGEAVVVDRSGAVVEAETSRLLDALEARGLRVTVRVRTSDGGGADDGGTSPVQPGRVPMIAIPFQAALAGCEALRRWGQRPEGTDAGADGGDLVRVPERSPAQSDLGHLGHGADLIRSLDIQMLLLVGKGGVGKSTCAAAIALLLARDRPVTLLGTDPAGSLPDLLELTDDSRQEWLAGPSRAEEDFGDLRVRQVRAEERYRKLRELYRDDVERAFTALAATRNATLDRKVVTSLIDLAPPGVDEIFALLTLLEDTRPGGTVVVDTAPTGHLVRLISLPEIGLDWTRQLLRTIRKYRSLRGLDALSERLLGFAKRLKDLHLRLTDPSRSAAIVVMQPGPLVAAETRRLVQALHEGGVRVAGVLGNRWPAPDEPGAPGAVTASLASDPDGPFPVGSPTTGGSDRRHPSGDPHAPFVVRAPALNSPPVGPDALLAFTGTWVVDS